MTRPIEESVTTSPLPMSAVQALATLWKNVRESGSEGVSREELRPVARIVGTAARAANLMPEQLLVAVKQSWSRQAGFPDAEERYETQWVLTEMVSLCIREFYLREALEPHHSAPEAELVA